MEALIIYDNYTTDDKIIHGWGFSCHLDEHILFDAGEDGAKLLVNLNTLMGGFHLYKSIETDAEEVYGKLKENGFKNYGGTHCTGDFAKQFNTFEIAAGSRIVL